MFNKYQIGEYLYTRLPSYHQIVDEEQNNRVLKKFFEVLNESFRINMEELDKALAKTQASKCAEENLEELAKSLGADWISTIHPKYQRQIISMLIKLYQQKGTVDTIRFIASELSGFEAKIVEGDIPEEYFKPGDENKRLLTVKLQAPELDDPVTSQQHESTISEVISKFVPVHTKFVLLVTYFYDESHKVKASSSKSDKLTEFRGTESIEFRGDETLESKLKYLYVQESKFDMIGHPDVLGLLTNPLYRITNNFMTTKSRYDILHHSNLVIHTKYEKTFKDDYTKKEAIKYSYLYAKNVLKETEETEVEQSIKTLNQSTLELPQLGEEHYVHVQVFKQDTGDNVLNKETFAIDKNSIKVNTLDNNEVDLDTKVTKTDRVMVNYKVEEASVKDLGIERYVMRTSTSNCKLSTVSGRLSTPSYIDKVVQNDNITYIYE